MQRGTPASSPVSLPSIWSIPEAFGEYAKGCGVEEFQVELGGSVLGGSPGRPGERPLADLKAQVHRLALSGSQARQGGLHTEGDALLPAACSGSFWQGRYQAEPSPPVLDPAAEPCGLQSSVDLPEGGGKAVHGALA